MPITPMTVAKTAAMSLSSTAFCSPSTETAEVTASFMNSFQENAITNANAAARATPDCLRTSFWNLLAFEVSFCVISFMRL